MKKSIRLRGAVENVTATGAWGGGIVIENVTGAEGTETDEIVSARETGDLGTRGPVPECEESVIGMRRRMIEEVHLRGTVRRRSRRSREKAVIC